jgi:putative spermidine/putrescine transport system ATP-binding protein/putrescine transport system ATP-binding protein
LASALEFRNVSKRFGDVTAVDDVSFAIKERETVALLGPSGCGKTTILRCIAGFERPESGSISIGGIEMTGLKPYERNVGLLFQHYALFPHMNVAENIAYGLRYRGVAKAEIPVRVEDMVKLVRLAGLEARRPHQLSGGQQQRVALARALATRPSLVLLDEPLSALDAKLRLELRDELKQLLAAVGSTTIVVTHDQEEAMSLGERIFVMNRGRIAQSGTADDVYRRPASRFVADFMGRANWLSGRVETIANGGRRFVGANGLGPLDLGRNVSFEGEAELCLRPECVDLLARGASAPAGGVRLEGKVADVILLGANRQVVVEIAGVGRLTITQVNRADNHFAPGSPAAIAFAPGECAILPARAPGVAGRDMKLP